MELESKYFTLFGINIHFYGILIALAIAFAIFVVIRFAKVRNFTEDDIWTVALYAIPLGIIGARIYFCVFSEINYTFVDFFKIWEGGLAVYGSIIGGALGAILYCTIHKKNFLKLADVLVVGVAIGQCVGRIGCYFGGCCYGIEVTNTNLQWFPLSVNIDGVWHYSTFFYESICALVLFFILILILKRKNLGGVVFSSYMIGYGIIRGIIEIFRGDSLYLFSTKIKVSWLVSIVLIACGVALLIFLIIKNKKNVNDNRKNTKEDRKNTKTK